MARMERRLSVRLQKMPRSGGIGVKSSEVSVIRSSAMAPRPLASCAPMPARLVDQLDLVAVRILDEGDHGGAVLHRPGLAGNLPAALADFFARRVDVVDADGDVPVRAAELVARDTPVV